MKYPKWSVLGVLAFVALAAANAQASGFQRMDAASPYLGTAGAGQAADTSVSSAFNNPAGLIAVDSADLYLGAVLGYDSLTFHDNGSEGISPGYGNLRRDGVEYGTGWSGGPAFHFAMPVSDRLSLGISLASPFGGAADFGEGWVGSHFSEEAELNSALLKGSLGFRISDNWSVGAALGAQYLGWALNVDLPPAPFGPVNPGTITPDHPMYAQLLPPGSEEDIEIDDVQPYWSLGTIWQPRNGTVLGWRYIPEIEFDLAGRADILAPIPDMTVVKTFDVGMKMATPSVTTISLQQNLSSKWLLLADIEHTGWSAWNHNHVVHDGGPDVVIERNWKDTRGYSLGFHYRASMNTVLKFGIGYDESPVSAENLKVDPPMDRQLAYALGIESQLTDRLRLVGAYQYLDMGDIRVDQTVFPGQVIRGHSDANAHVFHLGLRVRF